MSAGDGWGGREEPWGDLGGPGGVPSLGGPTLSLPSSVRERLKPEFLFSALMALMAPQWTSSLACSGALLVL